MEITCVDIPENGLEILSRTCHKLKNIEFSSTNCTGIDKLIIVNPGLLSLDLGPSSVRSPILGDMLEIIGLHCPLLQKCLIGPAATETTDTQMETFTKGCPNLTKLSLGFRQILSFKILSQIVTLSWK